MGFFKACKGCGSRTSGCHGTCPKYRAELEEYDRLMTAERQRKDTRQGLNDQRTEAVQKAVRHWRKWK